MNGKSSQLKKEYGNMFWVYIIKCSDGSYYTGHTDNLEIRISQHKAGECPGYTAKRLPVEFLWSQEFNTREEALAAERQIKGWSRKKKEAMMRGDWAEVSRLAQSKSIHALRLRSGERSTGSPRTDLLLLGDDEGFDSS
jgi:putative endonuclease